MRAPSLGPYSCFAFIVLTLDPNDECDENDQCDSQNPKNNLPGISRIGVSKVVRKNDYR
jgi:hypothetical protein